MVERLMVPLPLLISLGTEWPPSSTSFVGEDAFTRQQQTAGVRLVKRLQLCTKLMSHPSG